MLNDIPVLYAARHPKSGHWFVDESRDFVAGLAGHEGTKVVTLDVPGMLRVMRAAADLSEALSDEFQDATDWKDAKSALQTMGRHVASALAALTKESE